MFRVDKGANAPRFLLLCHAMQRQRCLTRGFRAINLNDAPHRQATDTKRDIKAKRACGAGFDILDRPFGPQFHNRPFAELTFDLGQRAVERLLLFCGFLAVHRQKICRCH